MKKLIKIDGTSIVLSAIAAVLTSIIFIIDIHVTMGIAVGAMYCIVILYSWLLPGKQTSVYAALICSNLIILGMIYSADPGLHSQAFGINRIISIIVVWVSAFLVIIAKRSLAELELSQITLSEEVKKRTLDLQLSEERVRLMVDEIEDYAIVFMDMDGNVENWNKGAKRIKGYRSNEIIGKNFRIFYTKKDRNASKPEKLLQIAMQKGKVQDEGWRVRKDGRRYWSCVTINAIRDEEGKIIGFSKVVRDLTEKKKTEDALLQNAKQLQTKNKELEQFAYIASHDLQEPLQTVISLTKMFSVKNQDLLDNNGKKSLKFIVDATTRMSNLIKGLLDYSRIGGESELKAVDCNEILNEIREDLSIMILNSKAKIEVMRLPVLKGYRTDIRQLFQNLITNAIKFQRTGMTPRIKVTAKKVDKCYKFSIHDNGIGIPEAQQEKIFVIFQRLHNRKKFEGTGIGLSYCRKIVDLHGGKIWVDSEPGFGSTFHFTIPLDKKHNLTAPIVDEYENEIRLHLTD